MRQLNSSKGVVNPSAITTAAAIAAILSGAAGCQRLTPVPEGRIADKPLVIDEAMVLRDWEPVVAFYENPRFTAGPTGYLYEVDYDQPYWTYYLIDVPLFVGQTIALPVTLIIQPPWTAVQYAGETIPPTYYAMPPLPPPLEGDARDSAAATPDVELEPRPETPPPPTPEPLPGIEPLPPGETGPSPLPPPRMPQPDPEKVPAAPQSLEWSPATLPGGPRARPSGPTTAPAAPATRELNK